MKVLLIEPPFNPNMERSIREFSLIPLELGSLAGFLESAGFLVEILDAVPMGWEDISKKIKESNPDVVGIGTYTHGVNQARELCSLVKYTNPKILIVLGGHHFDENSSIQFLSKVQEADVIVMGEGEEVLRDLLVIGAVSDLEGYVYSALFSLVVFLACLMVFHLSETVITERL